MLSIFVDVASRFGFKAKEAERFFRFLVVGTIGFVVDFGTLTLLKELAGLATLVANTISFSAAVLSNFTFNRYWTYPDSRTKRILAQVGQFAVVSILGLILNNAILLFLESPFDDLLSELDVTAIRGYIPAKMIATVVVLFWNFFVNRYWTYSDVE
jgi:putative flippase GtrA